MPFLTWEDNKGEGFYATLKFGLRYILFLYINIWRTFHILDKFGYEYSNYKSLLV